MNSQTKFGISLLMLSNLLFAIGNVLISKWEGQKRWNQSLTSNGLTFGFILALVVTLVAKQSWSFDYGHWRAWILPLYLGFIATGLGFFLWNRGVQKVSAFPASLIGNFKAPLSVFWGVVLLHERFDFKFLIGLVLLFCSAVMVRFSKRV